jgi:hypothetical protein
MSIFYLKIELKKYFDKMKGGTLYFFCPVLAPAKGGKPGLYRQLYSQFRH